MSPNGVGAGLERYKMVKDVIEDKDEVIDETKRAIEEANALETPLLERNLIALSTIASTGTMFGLLGTTIGMIRAFQAMGHADLIEAHDGTTASSADLEGRPFLLFFYPKASTPG